MRPAEHWPWRGGDLSWRGLTSALAASAAIIALGALLLLRPGHSALEDTRRDIRQLEHALLQHRRAMAEWPAQTRLETRISSIQRDLAACETARRKPAVFIRSIDPGVGGKLTWRAAPLSPPGHDCPRRWTVAATTDYPGLRLMLKRLAELSGGLSLASFAVAARGGVLDIEFELAEPAPGTDHGK